MGSPQEDFEHDLNTLKKYFRAAGYHQALAALEFAEPYHAGVRKDGITPNFHHQVRIAFSVYDDRERIKAAGLSVDEVLAAAVMHDTYEDNQDKISISELGEKFTPRIARLVLQLSKIRKGVQIPTEQYYQELLDYPEALIVKLHDRRNNVETMASLPPEKMANYFLETQHLLEVAKEAINKYPKLESLIQHSRSQIKQYLKLYRTMAQKAADGTIEPIVTALQSKGILAPGPALPAPRGGAKGPQDEARPGG